MTCPGYSKRFDYNLSQKWYLLIVDKVDTNSAEYPKDLVVRVEESTHEAEKVAFP